MKRERKDLLKKFNKARHIFNTTKSARIRKKQEKVFNNLLNIIGQAYRVFSKLLNQVWNYIKGAIEHAQREGVLNV